MNSGNQQPEATSQSTGTSQGTAGNNDLAASPPGDLTLILVLLAIFIFHSPFTGWWSNLGLPWYSIFVFWLLLIVLLALHQLKKSGASR